MIKKSRLINSLMALALFLVLAPVSVGEARDYMDVIDNQAWAIDPQGGEPSYREYKKEFEAARKTGHIYVFKVNREAERAEVLTFTADGELISATSNHRMNSSPGGFSLYSNQNRLGLNNDTLWMNEIKDDDTIIQSRKVGDFVLRRVPDFKPKEQ